MQDIEIIQNGERVGTIKFHNDGGCSTFGTVGEWHFSNFREMLLHLSGFEISFQDLSF